MDQNGAQALPSYEEEVKGEPRDSVDDKMKGSRSRSPSN